VSGSSAQHPSVMSGVGGLMVRQTLEDEDSRVLPSSRLAYTPTISSQSDGVAQDDVVGGLGAVGVHQPQPWRWTVNSGTPAPIPALPTITWSSSI
jgi:hypothetical protein